MPQLNNSKIYRGGVTAPNLTFETNKCSASVDMLDRTLDIRFELASKGGGTTQVLLQVGKDDFQTLLQEIANKLPESVAILSECATIANRKNLQLLEDARKVHANEKARAKSLVNDLEFVESFVSDKFNEAPVGEDEQEEKARDQLQKVISTLRELR